MIVYEGKGEKSVPQDASLKSKVGEVYQRAVWPAKDCGLWSVSRCILSNALLPFSLFYSLHPFSQKTYHLISSVVRLLLMNIFVVSLSLLRFLFNFHDIFLFALVKDIILNNLYHQNSSESVSICIFRTIHDKYHKPHGIVGNRSASYTYFLEGVFLM